MYWGNLLFCKSNYLPNLSQQQNDATNIIHLVGKTEGREKRKAKAEAEAKTERSNELNCKKQTTIF